VREKNPVTHEEKLAYLRELRDEAIHAGSEEAVQKLHEKRKLTAWERIEPLPAGGSIGEVCNAMQDVFGEYRGGASF
jgi:acetyl-CoA carboxylase carboxyltransferase component